MNPAVSLAFVGVAAAFAGAGVNARRRPELGQDHRLWYGAAALFVAAALLGPVAHEAITPPVDLILMVVAAALLLRTRLPTPVVVAATTLAAGWLSR